MLFIPSNSNFNSIEHKQTTSNNIDDSCSGYNRSSKEHHRSKFEVDQRSG